MKLLIEWLVGIGDKVGALGALVATMGCAMCFPAMASLGAALGLGFLSQWEGLFVNTLLPVFAWMVLVLHGLGWFAHRQWHRALPGMVGPVLLLLSLYPWFQYGWGTWVTYFSLALMAAVAVWDLVSPASRHCSSDDQCARPTARETAHE